MDGGAALRAKAISASRSGMRYWSRGAIVGYGFLASCACACRAVLRATVNAENPNAIVLTVFRFIWFSPLIPLTQVLKYVPKLIGEYCDRNFPCREYFSNSSRASA